MQQLMYNNPAPAYSYCQAPFPVISCDSVLTFAPNGASEKIICSLFPNPTTDHVTLNINNSNNEDFTLYIYNIVGALVMPETIIKSQSQLNIGDLNNGIYLIVIKSMNFIESKKLVIQR